MTVQSTGVGRPRTSRIGVLLPAWALLAAISCGGSPPTSPGPAPQPPPVSNAAPVIDSVSIAATRLEVGGETTVTATVRDAETPVASLTYQWTATAGTFTGQGSTVTWKAPEGVSTPQDYPLTLTVIEQYGTANARQEHRVTSTTAPIRVHDSPRELSNMTIAFLSDFANSSVAPETAVRDFWDGCAGKAAELADVRDNRQHYDNLGFSLGTPRVTLDGARLRANMTVSCQFTSFARSCPSDEPQCRPGTTGTSAGECRLTGVYESRRWWLCDSGFAPRGGTLRLRFSGR